MINKFRYIGKDEKGRIHKRHLTLTEIEGGAYKIWIKVYKIISNTVTADRLVWTRRVGDDLKEVYENDIFNNDDNSNMYISYIRDLRTYAFYTCKGDNYIESAGTYFFPNMQPIGNTHEGLYKSMVRLAYEDGTTEEKKARKGRAHA